MPMTASPAPTSDAPASPYDALNVAELTEQLCRVEAHLAAVGAIGAQIRDELATRAVRTWRADGVAPTWRAAGLGTVSLTVPNDKTIVDDPDALASWVAQRTPANVTATITIDVPPERLDDTLREVRDLFPDLPARADAQVRPGYLPALLDAVAVLRPADDAPGETLIVGDDGTVVDGLRFVPAPAPKSISVRLADEVKRRAVAEASAQVAAALGRSCRRHSRRGRG
jgi:hypothetical protein